MLTVKIIAYNIINVSVGVAIGLIKVISIKATRGIISRWRYNENKLRAVRRKLVRTTKKSWLCRENLLNWKKISLKEIKLRIIVIIIITITAIFIEIQKITIIRVVVVAAAVTTIINRKGRIEYCFGTKRKCARNYKRFYLRLS